MSLPPPSPTPAPSPPPARVWAPPANAAPAPAEPRTARDLLFPAEQPTVPSAAVGPAVATLPGPLRSVVRQQAQRSILDALDNDLAEIVVRGWLRHKALREAAERTRDAGREVVDLADHTITSVHRPSIDLSIDGATVTTLHLTLELSIRVVGVIAVVERASLVGLQSGAFEVTGSLKIANDKVASRTHRLDAVHAVTLARPRPLLAEQAS